MGHTGRHGHVGAATAWWRGRRGATVGDGRRVTTERQSTRWETYTAATLGDDRVHAALVRLGPWPTRHVRTGGEGRVLLLREGGGRCGWSNVRGHTVVKRSRRTCGARTQRILTRKGALESARRRAHARRVGVGGCIAGRRARCTEARGGPGPGADFRPIWPGNGQFTVFSQHVLRVRTVYTSSTYAQCTYCACT